MKDYSFVSSRRDWTKDSFFKVSNHGSATYNNLSSTGLVDLLLSPDLFDDLLKELKKKGRSDRGSVQRYAGYASTLNQKFDEDHSVTAPQKIGSMTEEYVEKMVAFTSLIGEFCREFSLGVPYSDDGTRNTDWAQRLCGMFGVKGKNTIEQCTFALTCLDVGSDEEPLLFGAHVDHLNDPQWSEVFCVYKHFYYEGRLYRLAAIAYSRSIIRKFRFKEIAYGCLRDRLMSYLRSPTNSDRLNISLDTCVPMDPSRYIREDGISYRKSVPCFDKAGFYSGFVDAILKVWDGRSIERACELLILVGWIPTATTFQKILTGWEKDGLPPDDIWTLAYIEQSIRLYGGLSNGPGPRCQPWMNRPLLYGAIVHGLQTIRNVTIGCIHCSLSPRSEDMSYVALHKTLCSIGGVGELGAQHIIGVASLLNLIPAYYQTIATIAPKTKTAKKVRKLYNLSTVVLEKQKSEIASMLVLSEKVVESGYCEMFREADYLCSGDTPSQKFDEQRHAIVMADREKKPRHPDVYFCGQILRTVRHGILVELYRDSKGDSKIQEIPFGGWTVLKKANQLAIGWWNSSSSRENSRIISTSRTHDEGYSDAIGRTVKLRVYTRKKVVHSGFGIHKGLEERLRERKYC